MVIVQSGRGTQVLNDATKELKKISHNLKYPDVLGQFCVYIRIMRKKYFGNNS